MPSPDPARPTGASPSAATPAPAPTPTPTPRALAPATLAVTAGRPPRTPDAAVNPDVVLTSTYVASTDPGARGYGRTSNPTWEALEEALGALEGAPSRVFASGMAAVSAALAVALDEAWAAAPGSGRSGGAAPLVVVPDGAYNTTLALLEDFERTGRVRLARVDVADTDAVLAALAGASLLWLESPTNPLLVVADVVALCSGARERGVRTVVDATFATPLVLRPLDVGADLVVHSATKYLAGHSDVLLGVVATREPALLGALVRHRALHGGVPGPFEAWLVLRGLRTLPLRLERAQANAAELARRLAAHPGVQRVRHPSLPTDPGHARAAAQMSGFGAIISIEVAGGAARAEAVQSAVRLWLPATSLGGVESTLERRRRHPLEPTVVPESLLRLSVGVEDVEDLWADLAAALEPAGQR